MIRTALIDVVQYLMAVGSMYMIKLDKVVYILFAIIKD